MCNGLCSTKKTETINSTILCNVIPFTLENQIGSGKFGIGLRDLYWVDFLGLLLCAERDLDVAHCELNVMLMVGESHLRDS